MTNGVKLGDCVHIVGTYVQGVVTAIDDHPLDYAQIEIENVLPIRIERHWYSCRYAKIVREHDGLQQQ